MNRRDFIGISALSLIAMGKLRAIPITDSPYSKDLLIGKSQSHLVGSNFLMHKSAFTPFQEMSKAAAAEGFKIEVVSAFRNFERQKQIFEGKYSRYTGQGMKPMAAIEKIIEYSTIPGTSRHHWGTDMDLIDGNAPRPESVLLARHFHGEGPFCKFKEWMDEHAEDYGFLEVYTDQKDRKGFKYEPWHFSYAPVSKDLLKAYKELNLKEILLEEKVMGSQFFTDEFIFNYRRDHLLDINPELLK